MKFWKVFLIAAVAGVTLAGGDEAWAHGRRHGHASIGVVIGAPLWPWYYPTPYYYPQVITVPVAPPVYVEQGSPTPSQSYWHYCRSREAYYPYVKDCPEAWEKVAPQP